MPSCLLPRAGPCTDGLTQLTWHSVVLFMVVFFLCEHFSVGLRGGSSDGAGRQGALCQHSSPLRSLLWGYCPACCACKCAVGLQGQGLIPDGIPTCSPWQILVLEGQGLGTAVDPVPVLEGGVLSFTLGFSLGKQAPSLICCVNRCVSEGFC